MHPTCQPHKHKFLLNLHNIAKMYSTCIHVWSLLKHIITSLLNNQPLTTLPSVILTAPTYLRHHLIRIWTEQSAIGWDNMLKGHVSTQWRLAQKKSYQQYPQCILKKIHNPTSWINAIIKTILQGALTLWQLRCEKKKGHTLSDTHTIQKKQVVKIYHRILSTKQNWPSHYHQSLPTEFLNPRETSLSTLLHWIHTYQDCQSSDSTNDNHRHPHDEWIRVTHHQKKGLQLYFLPDGKLAPLHI